MLLYGRATKPCNSSVQSGGGAVGELESHCPSENPNEWFQISPGRVGQILLSNSPTKLCKQGMDVEGGD